MANYTEDEMAPWSYAIYQIKKVVIEEGVTSIGEYALFACMYVEDLTLPSTLTAINDHALHNSRSLDSFFIPKNVKSIGTSTFCESDVSSIEVDEDNPYFRSIDGVLFDRETSVLIRYPPWRESENYTVPEGVVSIEDYAFSQSRLKNVYIPTSVRSIGSEAFSCCSSLVSVTISNGVKSIGNSSFFYCNMLASVIIPASVEHIGVCAFCECYKLKSIHVDQENTRFTSIDGVLFDKSISILLQFPAGNESSNYTFPENVTAVGDHAFDRCSKLQAVHLTPTITSISNHAFEYCSKLMEITIPDSVLSIGDYAFSSCHALNSISIPDGVTSIGEHAFSSCDSLTGVIIPPSVKTLGGYAFSRSGLKNVTISGGSIGEYCFMYCSHLSDVTISNGVNSIGDYAFTNCGNLKSVFIPKSVSFIGENVFDECNHLTSLVVDETNEHYKSINGVLFDHECSRLITYPKGKENTTYDVPDCVRVIGNYAFHNCYNLKNITLPVDLTTIGEHGFSECYNLNNVIIPEQVTSIGDYAFSKSNKITDVIIPRSVVSIGNSAFASCEGIINLFINQGVRTIGNSAFSRCTKLVNATIPSTVTSIGEEAFCLCGSLKAVFIPASVESIGSNAFYGCSSLCSIEVEDNNQFYNSKDGVLFDNGFTRLIQYPRAKNNTEYQVPDTVVSIASNAFDACIHLISITLPNGLATIGNESFYYCNNLKNVTIPDGVTSIGVEAFSSCSALKSLVIPDSVESIGLGAFASCSNLKSVFYVGSQFIPSDFFYSFHSYHAPELVCVSPDYQSSSFGGVSVNSSKDGCDQFHRLFNHCFKPTYFEGGFIQTKRKNATDWEDQTNDCVEYHCVNESGRIGWSLCNSTDTVTRLCVNNDKCEEKNKTIDENTFVVEIELEEGINVAEMNTSELVTNVSSLTGVPVELIKIGYETNDNGDIIYVLLYVGDKDDANKIVTAVSGLDKGGNCEYGAICSVKRIRVLDSTNSQFMIVSSGNRITINLLMLIMVITSAAIHNCWWFDN